MSICFYISGHGFGHASRDVEIVNAIARRRPGTRLLLRTSVAPWLLERTISIPYDLDPEPCDTGVVQIDSLRLDAKATIERARGFYASLDARAEREANLLRQHGVQLVLSDAPPLACAAAARAGVPSIVVGNFTWDWIYSAYAEELQAAPHLIPIIQNAYRHASEAWRLPLHGGFEVFDTACRSGAPQVRRRDVPFVARHATHDRADTLARLNLVDRAASSPDRVASKPDRVASDPDRIAFKRDRVASDPDRVASKRDRVASGFSRKIALSSFGGYGVEDLDLASLDCLQSWDVVLTGHQRPQTLPAGVHFFEEHEIYDAGIRYEDLVAAVDVVVTKPGYGIVSECLANDTAMVYTSRGHFAEYPVMVAEMPRFLRCVFLDQDALLAGRWLDALERAHGAPEPVEHPATDGADVIAGMIAARL